MAATRDIEKSGADETVPEKSLGHINGTGPSGAARPSRIGNPGPLGLFSFASTTFILSLYNLQTRSINSSNVVVGMAVFCGGLTQLLAGMWEYPRGNAFGATAFSSYGAFWMSYATILIPGSGVLAAFAGNERELRSALGIYLITWFMVTFFLMIAALRKNWGFISLLALLALTFVLLAAGQFTARVGTTKAGGATGAITAMIAYYIGLSELLAAEEMAVVRLPIGVIRKAD